MKVVNRVTRNTLNPGTNQCYTIKSIVTLILGFRLCGCPKEVTLDSM